MSAPNTETANAPAVYTGGQLGTIIANDPTLTLGFYGATGAVQGTAAANGDTLPHLVAYLVSLGLLR
jgi:hypothetical protein